jgi:D-ribulokinase
MIDVVLGIDVGTSGVRIAARDRDGACVAMMSLPMDAPIGGKQDANIWWQTLSDVLPFLLVVEGYRVRAIAIDGTSGTIVPVDANGTPLAEASMYNDVANPQHVQHIKQLAPADTASLGATSPLARALPLTSATRILHQADWLMGKFTGQFDVSDENNALKTGYDPVLRRWPDWIESVGMDTSKLPRVVAAGKAVGIIRPDVAAAFGLPSDVVIVAGTTDGCAAFLASGADQPGDGVTSLGSTITLKLLSATPVFAPTYGIYSHRIGEQWLAGGASNSGGAVLKQFYSTEALHRLTAMMNPDWPTGLDYYPLPKPGERFPINDPDLQPRLTPRPDHDHVFLQGVLEGMAEIEALGYMRLAELGASPLKSIRSVGGGTANEAWTAIRLKKLGVPALSPASEHAAMGTARLAWRGIGYDA